MIGFCKPEGGNHNILVTTPDELLDANQAGNRIIVSPTEPLPWTIPGGKLVLADDLTLEPEDGCKAITLCSSIYPGNNNILRRVSVTQGAVDGFAVHAHRVTDVWLDQVAVLGPLPDGGIDIASSLVNETTPPCRVTITDSTILNVDKALGIDLDTKRFSEPKYFVALERVEMLNCRQRCPRVGLNAVVEMRHCRMHMAPDAGSAIYIYGGKLLLQLCTITGPERAWLTIAEGGQLVEHCNHIGMRNIIREIAPSIL